MKIEESILRVLLYFDLFDYPLTPEEIHQFIDQSLTKEELAAALQLCKSKNKIFQTDDFYSIQNNDALAERRRKGNQQAAFLLSRANPISKRLYQFPFVRAIGVSGSVSKNFADENADIDYFVITKANRLWLARTFLHLFKKIPFLKNRNQWYCMNYFVDEAALEIEEKNIYTATDLITLMPMYGAAGMNRFFAANEWAFSFFPNFHLQNHHRNGKPSSVWIKNILEFLLNNKMGNWLDDYFFRLTTKRWQLKEKQGRLNTKGESMGLKTSKHCSKPNPLHFHDSFLKKYEERLAETKSKWSL